MTNPTLSVIIPVFNDPAGIRDTLESCVNQSYPDEQYEVIPVDNASNDETWVILAQYARMYPDLVATVEERQPGSYAARNRGIAAASGEVCVFIDADMTAPPDWLASVADRFANPALDYLGYAVDVYQADGSTFWGWYDEQLALPAVQYFRDKHFAPTCALAVRASVFARVGGFIPTLQSGGDKEFGIRCWATDGVTCRFDPTIVVRHPARQSFGAQYRKARRVATGLVDLAMLGVDDGDESRLPVPDYVLPPDPRRVSEQQDADGWGALLGLWLAACVISYTQVVCAGRYWLRARGSSGSVGSPAPVRGDA